MTFRVGAQRSRKSWKRGPDDSVERPKRIHTFLGCNSYRFASVGKKMCRSNFNEFSWTGHHWRSQSWKSDPDDYVWHRKRTHAICGAVSIIFGQYGWKVIRSNFDDFSGPRFHRCRKSWKPSPYGSVLHPKYPHIIRDTVLIIL